MCLTEKSLDTENSAGAGSVDMDLLAAVKDYVAQTGMLGDCRRILAALSGGPDSVALLSLLARMRTGDAGFALEAVHVNHGIRGGEADRDEEFCVSLCAQLRIPLTVRRADVPALAKRGGLSLEEAAREARYAVFAQICREKPEITHVATAHHASDNAETVLLHMIRGSGGRGLSGIPPSRPLSADSAVRLIRPLLCVDRADILRYLAAKELPFVSDSSNEDCRFARNALRHTILPLLHKMNPSVTQSLNRTAALAAQDEDYLQSGADAFLLKHGGGPFVPRRAFRILHPALRVRVLRTLFEKAGGRGLSTIHLADMDELVRTAASPKFISLPGGLRLYADAEVFAVQDSISRLPKADVTVRTEPLTLRTGLQQFDSLGFAVSVCSGERPDAEVRKQLQNIYKLLINTAINFDKINGNLYLRFRSGNNAEDRYCYDGYTHTVKDALSAHKVPQMLRKSIPLFCDGSGILWIPGCRVCDSVRPVPGCRVLSICYACSPGVEWSPRGLL